MRRCAKDQLERLRLERENRIVVDESLAVERASLSLQRRELRGHALRAVDLLDPEVRGVAESSRRRVVRARLIRRRRRLRAKRADLDDRRTGGSRPPGEAAKVGEVADAPAVLRTRGVELDRPSPCSLGGRGASPVAGDLFLLGARRFVAMAGHRTHDRVDGRGRRFHHVALDPCVLGDDPPALRRLRHQPRARKGSGTNTASASRHAASAVAMTGSSRTSHARWRSACSSTASTPIARGAAIASPRASSARPT